MPGENPLEIGSGFLVFVCACLYSAWRSRNMRAILGVKWLNSPNTFEAVRLLARGFVGTEAVLMIEVRGRGAFGGDR